MMLYRTMFGLAALAAIIVVWFFIEGLGDGSISSVNIGLWLFLLAVLGIVLGGSVMLRAKGQTGAASLLAALIAVPALLIGGFVGLLLLTVERWN